MYATSTATIADTLAAFAVAANASYEHSECPRVCNNAVVGAGCGLETHLARQLAMGLDVNLMCVLCHVILSFLPHIAPTAKGATIVNTASMAVI